VDSRLSSHFFRLRGSEILRERSHIAHISIRMHSVRPCFWGFSEFLRISANGMPYL